MKRGYKQCLAHFGEIRFRPTLQVGLPTIQNDTFKCNCSSFYCIIKFASSSWDDCRSAHSESKQNAVILLLQLMDMDKRRLGFLLNF